MSHRRNKDHSKTLKRSRSGNTGMDKGLIAVTPTQSRTIIGGWSFIKPKPRKQNTPYTFKINVNISRHVAATVTYWHFAHKDNIQSKVIMLMEFFSVCYLMAFSVLRLYRTQRKDNTEMMMNWKGLGRQQL
jgi:hypothetical protein